MDTFKLVSGYNPTGDQPQAIRELTEGLLRGDKYQTLLGVTGSGKTFTMANVIAKCQHAGAGFSHNKTLAAQLSVNSKPSFRIMLSSILSAIMTTYQPEAYVPSSDTYIEKDSSINDEIDRLRLKATSSLLSRKDVIIVARCRIYGHRRSGRLCAELLILHCGQRIERNKILSWLVDMFTPATISISRAAPFTGAATWWKSCRLTSAKPIASKCSAMKSNRLRK
jgi:excinuclease ABC subunit B